MKILTFTFLNVCMCVLSYAQQDLRLSSSFFQENKDEYQKWLSTNSIGDFLMLNNIDIFQEKIVVVLNSKHKGKFECDSLKGAWYGLRKKYYQDNSQPLHTAMLEKLCFQMDISLDSAEILINCPDSLFCVRIYGERSYDGILTVRFEEDKVTSMGNDILKIHVNEMKDMYKSGQTKFENNPTIDIRKVRKSISDFFYNKYKTKGTWLWNAQIDTSRTHFNEFTYKITHISGEVLKDKNFFEYHYINVKIEQIGEVLTINWNFQAKYGGGLIYPPRENSGDYHDIENSPYKQELEEYQREMFKNLDEYLKKM